MVRLRQIEMEQNEQRGFALPVAVFALVVVGVITTGGFFMARQEGRIGVANENTSLALYLTEQGLVDVIATYFTVKSVASITTRALCTES